MAVITNNELTLTSFFELWLSHSPVTICEEKREAVKKCRHYLDNKIKQGGGTHYGINTGFGSLCNVRIENEKLTDLQHNLIRSHAAGMGDRVEDDIVSMMFLLKIINVSFGYSGVRIELLNKMLEIYNAGILPVVYKMGSLGASGDLAPLSHLALLLIGEGDARLNGKNMSSEEALKTSGIDPISLHAKEGLALINGTQFSLAHGLFACYQLKTWLPFTHALSALSLEAFNCDLSPYFVGLHEVRKQQGQLFVAKQVIEYVANSNINQREKYSVQDPYSFRCIPQVHGASFDAYNYVTDILTRELNSVTDNPIVFGDEDRIISGGNFHAQPIALALDFLSIALSELANISERRTYQLIGGERELPPYLSYEPGLESGLMIAQYTAASMVSQNKQLCTPASVDSIVSSLGQEDHVSMAANAGTKLIQVVNNFKNVLAIEWMTAAQAISFRKNYIISNQLSDMIDDYRKVVPVITKDRFVSKDLRNTVAWVDEYVERN